MPAKVHVVAVRLAFPGMLVRTRRSKHVPNFSRHPKAVVHARAVEPPLHAAIHAGLCYTHPCGTCIHIAHVYMQVCGCSSLSSLWYVPPCGATASMQHEAHHHALQLFSKLAELAAREAALFCAGVIDTRPLDSALRSVDQAKSHLAGVFELLLPLERRSATATPLQLRQVCSQPIRPVAAASLVPFYKYSMTAA